MHGFESYFFWSGCLCHFLPFQSYCQSGWLLIARFSNNDDKHWMKDSGDWWYDRRSAAGETSNPSVNADMISSSFWQVKGGEFKITRSDDSSHTPLLQTTGNCLGGQTFRSKLTSYGDFRNGKVWSSNRCLGSCTVQYGGQYKSTDGFQKAECSSDIQSSSKVGFWCDWGSGDGSVMMIGGGGWRCDRADHGIGITEVNEGSFLETGEGEKDFGYAADGSSSAQSYSLNLWIRWLTVIFDSNLKLLVHKRYAVNTKCNLNTTTHRLDKGCRFANNSKTN